MEKTHSGLLELLYCHFKDERYIIKYSILLNCQKCQFTWKFLCHIEQLCRSSPFVWYDIGKRHWTLHAHVDIHYCYAFFAVVVVVVDDDDDYDDVQIFNRFMNNFNTL